MMHGRGKSDEAIVAVKPVNQAAEAGWESAERRAEAKGNAGQTDTRRTQSRESVTQGLDRIRLPPRVQTRRRGSNGAHADQRREHAQPGTEPGA